MEKVCARSPPHDDEDEDDVGGVGGKKAINVVLSHRGGEGDEDQSEKGGILLVL